jgi:hypothetical protein
MPFQVEIEYWENKDGKCPIEECIAGLPHQHQARIFKKDEFFEGLTLEQLILKSDYFEKAKGCDDIWVLRYVGAKGYNYRMTCIIWKKRLVGLVFFEGSGSGGRLARHLAKSMRLAEDWKKRNP